MHKTPNQRCGQLPAPQINQTTSEHTNLSRLPRLSDRKSFILPNAQNPKLAVAVCIGCGGQIDRDDNLQQSIHGCRKCIGIYARIDTAIIENAKRTVKERLDKFFVEVQR